MPDTRYKELHCLVENMKKHPGMYVAKENDFDVVAAFLDGAMSMTSSQIHREIHEYVRNKFTVQSSRAWAYLVYDIHSGFHAPKVPAIQIPLVEFLFTLLLEFLDETLSAEGV